MTNFTTVDFIKVRIPDSLVKYNKGGEGSGEARLYVGGYKIRDWDEFFGNYKLKCFFDKQGLLDYLHTARFEYENPSQWYRRDISGFWSKYLNEINSMPDVIYFNIFRNNDGKNTNVTSRFYIKSTDKIYDFFRRIALPKMTSLLIQKIIIDGELQLWFRLYLNDIGHELDQQLADENITKIKSDRTIGETEKERILKSRLGQGYFRDLIIEKYKWCIISLIDDERILVASHIKPWISSSNSERLHQENGLLLSPTYDKLFDRGFISFKDNGAIQLSNHFSERNFERVGLIAGMKYDLKASAEMKSFLEFHRDTIFMK